MEAAACEKEASVRPNGVGELRIRERFDQYDPLYFKQGLSLTSFTDERENWPYSLVSISYLCRFKNPSHQPEANDFSDVVPER
jgi:hypothetical protein